MLPVPDSSIARKSEALLRLTSAPSLVNHCLRSYHWAEALADLDGVSHDPELLFVAAALHDLGLVEPFDTGAAFEVDSGTAARHFTGSHGWPDPRTRSVEEAIVLHMAPEITRDHGAEAYLLWHATSLDVAGSRWDELPSPTVAAVLAEHPRLDFAGHFGDLFAAQAVCKPGTRAGELVVAGLLTRLAECALDHLDTAGLRPAAGGDA
jgi:hypothetical protein